MKACRSKVSQNLGSFLDDEVDEDELLWEPEWAVGEVAMRLSSG